MKHPRISWEIAGRGGVLLRLPLPLLTEQIFKDDVNFFFLHLGYLLHGI
jgi:hypothetical protein